MPSVFINPKTDFAFKKIFGSKHSKDILISFLNALVYDEQDMIRDLIILDPYQAPRIKGIKDSYLDVKATLSDGKTVIIEMQVLNVLGFEKRVLYNAAKAFSIQLGVGEDYTLLNPIIALTITDFEMFPGNDRVLSRYRLKEKDDLTDYSDDIELIFVELPKFKKTLDDLQTLVDKWLYFLRSANQLESVPPQDESSGGDRPCFYGGKTKQVEPQRIRGAREARNVFARQPQRDSQSQTRRRNSRTAGRTTRRAVRNRPIAP